MNKYKEFFGDWADLFSPFLSSEEFKNINIQLRRLVVKGVEVTPSFNEIFRAFKECPLERFHTLIMGMDAYYTKNPDGSLVADGIAFSAKRSIKPPKSLEIIYSAIDEDIYQGWGYHLTEGDNDLKRWANQGILLLNASLSTVVGSSGAHMAIWYPFIKYVCKRINETKDSIGVILMGRNAQEFRPLLDNPTYRVLSCEHPVAASYRNGKWDYNHCFSQISEFQRKQNNINIIW